MSDSNSDGKVYCACNILIAPYEEKTVFNGRAYHLKCFKKLTAQKAAMKKPNQVPAAGLQVRVAGAS